MSSTCYASVECLQLRTAQLTATGAPSTGANKGYCTDAVIKLDVSVELRTGSEFEQKNGQGALCAVFKQPDRIKRLSFGVDLCQLDAELISQMTGADRFSSGGNTIGMQLPAVTGDDPGPVCLEAWSLAWDGDSQAVAPFTSPSATYIHWVFPFTRWVQGNWTLEDGIMVVPLTGQGEENAFITANGPYDDWPAAVATSGGVTRLGGWFLDSSLPATQCGFISVTSAAS